MKKNRFKIVELTMPCIETLLIDGAVPVPGENSIPKGARLISMSVSTRRQALQLVFEHESFKEVAEGNEMPVSVITFTTEKQ